MRPAQLGGTSRAAGGLRGAASVRAAGAVIALGAVVVGAKVHCLAAEGAALVDELLEFLDGHGECCGGVGEWCFGLLLGAREGEGEEDEMVGRGGVLRGCGMCRCDSEACDQRWSRVEGMLGDHREQRRARGGFMYSDRKEGVSNGGMKGGSASFPLPNTERGK